MQSWIPSSLFPDNVLHILCVSFTGEDSVAGRIHRPHQCDDICGEAGVTEGEGGAECDGANLTLTVIDRRSYIATLTYCSEWDDEIEGHESQKNSLHLLSDGLTYGGGDVREELRTNVAVRWASWGGSASLMWLPSGTPPGGCPAGRWSGGRPKTHRRDGISHLACGCLGIVPGGGECCCREEDVRAT